MNLLYRLSEALRESVETAEQVWERRGVVAKLVELQACGRAGVEEQARVCLSLLGYAPPYLGRGLRILSIDGGGTRSVKTCTHITTVLDYVRVRVLGIRALGIFVLVDR